MLEHSPRAENGHIVEVADCSLPPVPVGYFDKIAGDYDALYEDPVSLAENAIVADTLMDAVRRIPGSTVRVLDLGCGTGLVHRMLTGGAAGGKTVDYVGVDISGQMLNVFESRAGDSVRLVHENLNKVKPASLGTFDLVVSTFGSFSYVDDVPGYLRQIRDSLRDESSRIVLMVYSRFSDRNLRLASETQDIRWLDPKRPYAFRNDGTPEFEAPDAYFYRSCDLRTFAEGAGLVDVRVLGCNAGAPELERVRSAEEAKRILLQEMYHMKDPDRAHSLILTASKGGNRALHYIDTVLEQKGVAVERIEHEPVTTVEAADRVCPNPEEGLKTLLLKVKGRERLVLAIMRGSDRLDSDRIKQAVGGRASFVDARTAGSLLGCDAGAVAPLSPIDAHVVIDPHVLTLSRVYFNPGVNTRTYGIPTEALIELLRERGAAVARISEDF